MLKTKKKNRGFVLLYAVLVASIVAIGGTLLADIIAKQIVLSSVGRESQFAYYAATAGDECANYWNESLAFGFVFDNEGVEEYLPNPTPTIDCNGESIDVDDISPNSNSGVYTFVLTDLQQGACAIVTVTQQATPDPDDPTLIIQSRGYNMNNQGSCGSDDSSRLLERVITRSA